MIATSKLRKAMHEIAAKKGEEFSFFGLFQRADACGTWDLVASAWWLADGRLETLEEFHKLVIASLGRVTSREIGRLVRLRPDDANLRAVVSEYPVEDGEVRVKRECLFGLEIDDAIILQARKATARRARTASTATKTRKALSSKPRAKPRTRRLSHA